MPESPSIQTREADAADREWLTARLRDSWGSTTVVSRGQAYDASRLPAFVALEGDERVGLATFRYEGAGCELVTLDASHNHGGIGSALLKRVARAAVSRGCERLWLVTTNDNLGAIRFYQRRGMRLIAVHPGAVDEARRLKPSIPEIGEYEIPLHDELEFELLLDPADD